MTGTHKQQREQNLRSIFQAMNAERAQEIREAYYKAVEGLSALATALETADTEMGSPEGCALIAEHLLACQAIEAMHDSVLGRIL